MPVCVVDEVCIYYRQQGRGEPLVLLHCGLGTGGDFAAILPELAARYTVFTPDRPGYGRSGHDVSFDRSYFAAQAETLHELLERLDIPSVYLWGWSDGAIIALWLAILYPAQVRAVIVEAGHLRSRKYAQSFFLEHLEPQALPRDERQRLARQHGPDYWSQLSRRWARMWLSLAERDGELYAGRLRQIQAPTLVLHADDDIHIPLEEVEALHARIPGARLRIFPGGGHALHAGPAQKEVLTAALSFLQEVAAAE